MRQIAIAIAALWFLSSPVAAAERYKGVYWSDAQAALEAFGFTEVESQGMVVFGCGRDDSVRTGFIGRTPSGYKVEGVVCAGLFFKGWTPRIVKVLEKPAGKP